jgi:hypothetical protein
LPSQKFLVAICAVSAGGGLKVIGYTVVDPSLDVWGGAPSRPSHPAAPGGGPSHPIAPGGGSPANPIDPGGQPTPQRR